MSYQLTEHQEKTAILRGQIARSITPLDEMPSYYRQPESETPYEITGSEETIRALAALLVRMTSAENGGCTFVLSGTLKDRRITGACMTRRALLAVQGRCLVLREALLEKILEPFPPDGLAGRFITLTKVQWLVEAAMGLSLSPAERVRLF